jgi:hypothetical protein
MDQLFFLRCSMWLMVMVDDGIDGGHDSWWWVMTMVVYFLPRVPHVLDLSCLSCSLCYWAHVWCVFKHVFKFLVIIFVAFLHSSFWLLPSLSLYFCT